MNDFTASNGVTITLTNYGRLIVDNEGGTYPEMMAEGDHVQALREFFRAEEDERLGRWRWHENPDYVVYRDTERMYINQPAVIVFNETNGATAYCGKDGLYSTSGIGARDVWCEPAARAYFDAHPEPKPWHDAKPGEVWVLRIPTGPTFDHAPAVVSSSANGNAIFTAATYDAGGTEELALTATQITYATRIWPEDTE